MPGSDSQLFADYRMTTGECDSPAGIVMANSKDTCPSPQLQNSAADPPTPESVKRVVDEIRAGQRYRFPQPPLSNADADNPQTVGTVHNASDFHPAPRAGAVEFTSPGPGEPGYSRDIRRDIAQAQEQSEQSSGAKIVSEGSSVPKTWREAVPYVVWVVFVLGFGLEAVTALVHFDWLHLIVSLAGLACLMTAALHWSQIRSSVQRTNPNWIWAACAILLMGLILSPFIEQRRWPFAWQPGYTAAVPPASQLVSNPNPPPPDEGPISWQQPFQLMPIGTTTGTEISGLYFQGISNAQIQMKEAYIVSDLTGHREELRANVQYKGVFPVDQVDIPPGASVDLIYTLTPTISVRDFLDQWGKFRFMAVYNGISYEKSYDENFMRGLVQNTIPGVIGPRMTPKGQ